jgi:Cof subfamily protein (haloacid dehalogenase superfamily)
VAAERQGPAAVRVRVVAVDVDGTLLDSRHQLSQPTRAAVRAARDRGVEVVLCSSRCPGELKGILLELGLTAPAPFVAAQGGLTGRYDHAGRLAVEREQRLPLASARALVAAAAAAGVAVNWYDGERWVASRMDAAVAEEARIVGHDPEVADPLAEPAGPHKILLIAPPERPGALDELVGRLPGDLAVHRSKAGYLEVTAAGVDKAVAFDRLCAARGIGVEERAAIGDGYNDLGLFATVATSVAMGHAPAEVRRQASLVTASNDEHGVAQALQTLTREAQGPGASRSRR